MPTVVVDQQQWILAASDYETDRDPFELVLEARPPSEAMLKALGVSSKGSLQASRGSQKNEGVGGLSVA